MRTRLTILVAAFRRPVSNTALLDVYALHVSDGPKALVFTTQGSACKDVAPHVRTSTTLMGISVAKWEARVVWECPSPTAPELRGSQPDTTRKPL